MGYHFCVQMLETDQNLKEQEFCLRLAEMSPFIGISCDVCEEVSSRA